MNNNPIDELKDNRTCTHSDERVRRVMVVRTHTVQNNGITANMFRLIEPGKRLSKVSLGQQIMHYKCNGILYKYKTKSTYFTAIINLLRKVVKLYIKVSEF